MFLPLIKPNLLLEKIAGKTSSTRMLIRVILIMFSLVVNFGSPCCEKKERMTTYLDAAMDLISKAKIENITCPEVTDSDHKVIALDCADLYGRGYKKSGIYTIWPINRLTMKKGLNVYCDMITEGGGWTVILKRGDFGRSNDFFNQDWKSYSKGFGDLERDFWLGNDNIFALTNQKLYSVRLEMQDKWEEKRFAHYDAFWIDDENNKYTLHISGYRGNAGDAMSKHNNLKFSTKDQDNSKDQTKCGISRQSGWWFDNCYSANLNGMYNNQTYGIKWVPWKNEPLSSRAEIKIRPSVF